MNVKIAIYEQEPSTFNNEILNFILLTLPERKM